MLRPLTSGSGAKLFVAAILVAVVSAVRATDVRDLNDGWLFLRGNPSTAQHTSWETLPWTQVALPHTWNAIDGQDGGNDFYNGVGWYRRTLRLLPTEEGKAIYLDFGAANMRSRLFIDGHCIGEHWGGYSHFGFDITPYLSAGNDAVIDVEVCNSNTLIAPPRSADFTFFGGITRGVRLLVKNKVHINPLVHIDNASLSSPIDVLSDGVYTFQHQVSERLAQLEVKTHLRNTLPTEATTTLRVELLDQDGRIVADSSQILSLSPASVTETTTNLTLKKPHLWNGKTDPYLYGLRVTVDYDGETEEAMEPVGFRYYSVDKEQGFLLNGRPYPLRGIAIHDEVKDKGRAVSDNERRRDLNMILETGANFLRLAHYPHGDFTYRYLDSLGIVVWTEIPFVNGMGKPEDEDTMKQRTTQQLYEMIYQLQSHPAICFWGVCNEIRNGGFNSDPKRVVKHLVETAHDIDPTRLVTLAACGGTHEEDGYPDVYSQNIYVGWYYGGDAKNIGKELDDYRHKTGIPFGMSEYGAGGNILQHEDYPGIPKAGGQWHPEEYQNYYHEQYLKAIDARPWLWQTSAWVGFDFASDGRDEGDQPGINDKGLITHDRQTRKDAFFLYKATWNKEEPTMYITSRRFTSRTKAVTPVKVYTNCDRATLTVNGTVIGTIDVADHKAVWESVVLQPGDNNIVVSGTYRGQKVSDETKWTLTPSPSITQTTQE